MLASAPVARVEFALEMLRARLAPERLRCPYCESSLHSRLQRKWLLIELRQCAHCGLLFRYPIDLETERRAFYEGAYEGQQATDLPSPAQLQALVAENFRGSPLDKSARIDFLRGLQPTGKALDFGAAWGYSVHQLRSAGYDALGFELSRVRARFGREQLHVPVYDDPAALLADHEGSLDLIYTDHAMEHLPRLREPLERLARLLKPGGLLVIFVPNGGGQPARVRGTRWLTLIGEAHTVAFTASWFRTNLPNHGLQVEALRSTMSGAAESLLDGEELICVARRSSSST